MGYKKVGIVGIGNVGSSIAYNLALKNICNKILLKDLREDFTKAIALDISQAISSVNSKYVFLFDRDNQTFTVYESRPAKSADAYSYGLYYVFMFKFDIGTSKIIDIEIPDSSWNRPEMYILSTDGVNKIALYDFIESIQNDKVVKQLD